MSLVFESSVNGRLAPDTVLECGVCWAVYDPAKGDPQWNVPPGTAFTDLPEEWRCPQCDTEKAKFMVLNGGGQTAPAPSNSAALEATMEARVEALLEAYRRAEKGMLGLPVHNDALEIEAVGFRDHRDHFAGVVVTPWCMNITLIPKDKDAPAHGALGSTRSIAFPSGAYSFILGRMEGVGLMETCSLFSPMEEFDDPAVARACAEAAIEGLFEEPEPAPEQEKKPVSRRFVLTLNGAPQ